MINRINRLSQTKLTVERTPLEALSIYARLLVTVIVIALVVATSFFIYAKVSTEPSGLLTTLTTSFLFLVGGVVGITFAILALRYLIKNSLISLSAILLIFIFGFAAIVVFKLLPMNLTVVMGLAGLFTFLLVLQLSASRPAMPLIVVESLPEEGGGVGAFILLAIFLGISVFLLFLFS